jgi:hypothetical protein
VYDEVSANQVEMQGCWKFLMTKSHIAEKDRYASVTISEEELMRRKRPDRPVWQMVEELLKDIPQDVLDSLPTDGSEQHDHYIYGTPKRRA